MKKILILVLTLLACACTKPSKETSYTFIDEYGVLEQTSQQESMKDANISLTITLNEYQGGLCVATHTVNNPQRGTRNSFTAKEGSEYVTVRYHLKAGPKSNPSVTLYERNRWFKEAFLLTPGANTDIALTGTTTLTDSEPHR